MTTLLWACFNPRWRQVGTNEGTIECFIALLPFMAAHNTKLVYGKYLITKAPYVSRYML